MKHCPECNRNYADQTLSFCLQDGAPLIYGEAIDEPATAVLAGSPPSNERSVPTPATRASLKPDKLVWILGGLAVVAVLGSIFGYRYYSSASAKQIGSIAVLPFVNESGNQDLEYLSDGMTESVIRSLSQLPNLKVMSRTSVFHYKGKEINAQAVAKELNVQAVLTGTVSQRGDSLSTSVELIDPQDNSQIWSQQYSRRISDVFALQEEIAKEISNRLRMKLSGEDQQQFAKRPTDNIKAFQYYMRATALAQRRTQEDLLMAVSFCEKAIAEDPNYALAYAGLSDAYENLGLRGYIAPNEGRLKAQQSAQTALLLDENLAEGHAALGQAYITFVPSNFPMGDLELRKAIELSPSFAMAHFYLGNSLNRQGRLDEALEEYLKARELDPLSSIIGRNVAIIYYFKRDNARALEVLRQANELGAPFSTTWEIGVYIQNQLFDEALAELDREERGRKKDPVLIFDRGMIYAARGMRAEALKVIKELEDLSDTNLSQAHYIAKIYATMNENDLTLSWLERGLTAGAIGAFYKDEPVWDSVRQDPRFADLLRRMNVPQ